MKNQKTQSNTTNVDKKFPYPQFPEQHQEIPGIESSLNPLADHGETSYIGH